MISFREFQEQNQLVELLQEIANAATNLNNLLEQLEQVDLPEELIANVKQVSEQGDAIVNNVLQMQSKINSDSRFRGV